MVNPTEAKCSDLKRLGRFLKKYPDFIQIFAEQRMPSRIRVQVDSDHAGCAMLRCHPKIYDRDVGIVRSAYTQTCQPCPIDHIPFHRRKRVLALVKGGSTALGIQSLLQDLGLDLPAEESDSNSAEGTVSRIGLGKARHIQTRYLWLQERVAMSHLKVVHVPGKSNRAGALTKSVPGVQSPGYKCATQWKGQITHT